METQESIHEELDDAFEDEPIAYDLPGEQELRGGGGWMHFLVGSTLIGGAAAMVFGPEYSWRVGKISTLLQGYGIEVGVLVLGGLVFWGLGFVARSARKVAQSAAGASPAAVQHSGDSEFLLVADQLTTDMAQVMTAVLQITEELTAVGEAQRLVVRKVCEEEPATEEEHNALFRLAASLDQLNARVDQRLHEFDVQFRSRFESVTNAVHEARMALEAQLASGAAVPGPASLDVGTPDQIDYSTEPTMEFFDRIEAESGPASSGSLDLPNAALPTDPDLGSLDAILPDDSDLNLGPLG